MCLMGTFPGNRFLQNCCWISKSLPRTPTMFCFQLKPTNRLEMVRKKRNVIWVFLHIGQFVEISARELSNINPPPEDVDGKIWIDRISLWDNSKVRSSPDFLKRRYFFINLGIRENVVPSIIRIRKKRKTLFILVARLKTQPPGPPQQQNRTSARKKYEFRENKTFDVFIRRVREKKSHLCEK